MLSRILACFALFTGLAAIGAPVNASVVEAMQCEIGVTADAQDNASDDRHVCQEDSVRGPRHETGKTTTPNKRSRRVVRPPILFGIDRAHE